MKLPVPNTSMWGVRGWPVGGGDGFHQLSEENGYSLPFKVEGYYDLRDCEFIDGSGVFFPVS